jgi:hypothetical protein
MAGFAFDKFGDLFPDLGVVQDVPELAGGVLEILNFLTPLATEATMAAPKAAAAAHGFRRYPGLRTEILFRRVVILSSARSEIGEAEPIEEADLPLHALYLALDKGLMK